MTYRPSSYAELVQHAVEAVKEALREGETKLEVEFPPVPTKIDGEGGNRVAPHQQLTHQLL
jgi:hypothetical protein